MAHRHHGLDWPAVERGVTEHVRGVLTVAVGSPELLDEVHPAFQSPELLLKHALQAFITQRGTVTETFGRDETPYLLAQTIIPWIDHLRAGGYHPVPVLALHHFLTETTMPSISDEVVTIVARAEVHHATK